jgi:hypothetical protein
LTVVASLPPTIVIPRRYRGPTESGNGGYTCGRLAAFLGGEAEVTLRLPPPLERELTVVRDGDGARLLDGDRVVAEARPARVEGGPPRVVTPAEAEDATTRYPGFEEHAFPECFSCGPRREPGDGLRIFPGRLADGSGLVAAPWMAREVEPAVVWAAIDCAGAYAVGVDERGETVLGRMAARIDRLPREGEGCVVVGWPTGAEGRKRGAGTELLSASGETLAVACQVWIAPRA